MWANRITLAEYVYHTAARTKIQEIMNEKKLTDEEITDLHINTDGGYVSYNVIFCNGGKDSIFVFDDGSTLI